MIDLKRFCAKDDPRPYLNAPWQEDGSSFATNGHIAIKLTAQADAELPAAAPTMAGRIQKHLEQSASHNIDLPIVLPEEQGRACGLCGGSGRLLVDTCTECDGSGSFEHGSHTYDCKECMGHGQHASPALPGSDDSTECDCCDGVGQLFTQYVDLQADGKTYRYQRRYLRLISDLPSARLIVGTDPVEAARFEFAGGSGVLMPCRF
ncbi:hypothetical protein [Achromobacter sp. UMC46]|uniref:hypothetical protein n=1 Tax=Achromobacter sp. UMC46 TaxID=1862319 RepID=UPI001602D377|nr:hypothetical protein [Achromobacter sp. UMC46]MBB1593573.1 hypothetical protein [Achromobacter sp. UMC46]